MRDKVAIIGMTFIGIAFLTVILYYFMGDYKHNTVVQGLTETVRNTAIENAGNVSRRDPVKLYYA